MAGWLAGWGAGGGGGGCVGGEGGVFTVLRCAGWEEAQAHVIRALAALEACGVVDCLRDVVGVCAFPCLGHLLSVWDTC